MIVVVVMVVSLDEVVIGMDTGIADVLLKQCVVSLSVGATSNSTVFIATDG